MCLRSTGDRRVVDDDQGHQTKLAVLVVVVVVVVDVDDALAASIESSLESSNRRGVMSAAEKAYDAYPNPSDKSIRRWQRNDEDRCRCYSYTPHWPSDNSDSWHIFHRADFCNRH